MDVLDHCPNLSCRTHEKRPGIPQITGDEQHTLRQFDKWAHCYHLLHCVQEPDTLDFINPCREFNSKVKGVKGLETLVERISQTGIWGIYMQPVACLLSLSSKSWKTWTYQSQDPSFMPSQSALTGLWLQVLSYKRLWTIIITEGVKLPASRSEER